MSNIENILKNATDKGRLLELAVENALADYGFQNVRRQLSGSQFGFDILALKPNLNDGKQEVWKFECKNLEKPVTPTDIAPKLIWNYGSITIDRFVLVSTNKINNDLEHLLSEHTFPMLISIIAGEDLIKFLSDSPSAMKILGLSSNTTTVTNISIFDRQVYPCSSPAVLDVVHQLDPPHSFDYVLINSHIVKAFSPIELKLLTTITNHMGYTLNIHKISAYTVAYYPKVDRVLRLSKPKGIFNPVELTFRPTTNVHGEVEILKGKIWRVPSRSSEIACLLLDEDTSPGVYEFIMTANGKIEGTPVQVKSCSLFLHVPSKNEDFIELNVIGHHYDSPACQILGLDDETWGKIHKKTEQIGYDVYLGPSPYEILNDIQDNRWFIRQAPSNPLRTKGHLEVHPSMTKEATIVFDLGTPVDEKLYSRQTALIRKMGTDPWQNLFDFQLKRRKKANDLSDYLQKEEIAIDEKTYYRQWAAFLAKMVEDFRSHFPNAPLSDEEVAKMLMDSFVAKGFIKKKNGQYLAPELSKIKWD